MERPQTGQPLVPGTYPTVIVLERPGYPLSGSHKARCMICTSFFRISDQSYETVADLRREHRMYVVACYGCYRALEPKLPPEMRFGQREATISQARTVFGYS